jgi:HSP20 family protein
MATIVRWSPFSELESLERRMRSMFDEPGFPIARMPAADLYETDDQFVLEMEVPGFAEKELTVDVTDHTLRVKGERSEEKEEKEKAFLLHERIERSFERRFALPDEADAGKLKATFANGVLKLTAPKAPGEAKRSIPISSK